MSLIDDLDELTYDDITINLYDEEDATNLYEDGCCAQGCFECLGMSWQDFM
jgi:hypothetical protein